MPTQWVLEMMTDYQSNDLIQCLASLYPRQIEAAIAKYFVGTAGTYHGVKGCVFPYLDERMRFCYGKIIVFNPDGHRDKDKPASSVKHERGLKDFNRKQTYFGEHLLPKYPGKPLGIVESEKTALIASMTPGLPECIWLATGSKSTLKIEHLKRIGIGRKTVLFPDAGAFDHWEAVAAGARRSGLDVNTSQMMETSTSSDIPNGGDIAVLLVKDRMEEISKDNWTALRFEAFRQQAAFSLGCVG